MTHPEIAGNPPLENVDFSREKKRLTNELTTYREELASLEEQQRITPRTSLELQISTTRLSIAHNEKMLEYIDRGMNPRLVPLENKREHLQKEVARLQDEVRTLQSIPEEERKTSDRLKLGTTEKDLEKTQQDLRAVENQIQELTDNPHADKEMLEQEKKDIENQLQQSLERLEELRVQLVGNPNSFVLKLQIEETEKNITHYREHLALFE